jgi:hypothetical protein
VRMAVERHDRVGLELDHVEHGARVEQGAPWKRRRRARKP